ncbi:hypothetical protein D9611_007339 [Ephemerocybe angulata]|uniref:Uncharacterized protein n=1 Tax=Ephemerocybe angulata TaxID=980116 RepID=A0A8H5CF79_9AGAR|nr:hypothetical protein D9611_007339 [Tulosesus angulatus]
MACLKQRRAAFWPARTQSTSLCPKSPRSTTQGPGYAERGVVALSVPILPPARSQEARIRPSHPSTFALAYNGTWQPLLAHRCLQLASNDAELPFLSLVAYTRVSRRRRVCARHRHPNSCPTTLSLVSFPTTGPNSHLDIGSSSVEAHLWYWRQDQEQQEPGSTSRAVKEEVPRHLHITTGAVLHGLCRFEARWCFYTTPESPLTITPLMRRRRSHVGWRPVPPPSPYHHMLTPRCRRVLNTTSPPRVQRRSLRHHHHHHHRVIAPASNDAPAQHPYPERPPASHGNSKCGAKAELLMNLDRHTQPMLAHPLRKFNFVTRASCISSWQPPFSSRRYTHQLPSPTLRVILYG